MKEGVVHSLRVEAAEQTAERPTIPAVDLLARLQAAHHEVLTSVALMERVTSTHVPDVEQLTSARFKASQASCARRALWHTIRKLLLPNVASTDAAALQRLAEMDFRLFEASSAHISQWTVRAILADWAGYQKASRRIRTQMVEAIGAEWSLLYPRLRAHSHHVG